MQWLTATEFGSSLKWFLKEIEDLDKQQHIMVSCKTNYSCVFCLILIIITFSESIPPRAKRVSSTKTPSRNVKIRKLGMGEMQQGHKGFKFWVG